MIKYLNNILCLGWDLDNIIRYYIDNQLINQVFFKKIYINYIFILYVMR